MKGSCTKTIVFTSALLFSFALASCQVAPAPQTSAASQDTSFALQESAGGEGQASGQDASEPGSNVQQVPTALNPAEEPPLSKEDMEIAVPDFLTDDQKLLYCRAYRLYECFRKESAGVEDFPSMNQADRKGEGAQRVEVEGKEYCESMGRYQNWNFFSCVVNCVFTPELFEKLNQIEDTGTLYIEVDGVLYYQDVSFMSDDRLKDDYHFALVAAAEDRIEFQLLAQYSDYQDALDGSTVDGTVSKGDEFTRAFDMAMVRDQSGQWRFSQFEVPF